MVADVNPIEIISIQPQGTMDIHSVFHEKHHTANVDDSSKKSKSDEL